MIVCVCRGVSDRTIRALVAAGARTRDDVQAACGAGGDCGRCGTEVGDLIEETRGRGHRSRIMSPYVTEQVLG